MSPGRVSMPGYPSAARSRAAAATAPVCPSRAPDSMMRAPYSTATRRAAASTVTTASPARRGTTASAASTSSIIASISACRASAGNAGASRIFARFNSLTGTTAQTLISKTSAGRRQHRLRQSFAILDRQHQGLAQGHRNAEALDLPRIRLVGDKEVEDVFVMPRDLGGADRQAELGHDLRGRAFDGLATDDRRHGDDRCAARA